MHAWEAQRRAYQSYLSEGCSQNAAIFPESHGTVRLEVHFLILTPTYESTEGIQPQGNEDFKNDNDNLHTQSETKRSCKRLVTTPT
jgi:hypothetical protein